MERPDITQELQAYNSLRDYTETIENLWSSIAVLECQAKGYYCDANSDLAKVSKEYKDMSLHKADIKLRARLRLIERVNKHIDKIKEDGQARYMERLHEIQAYDTEGTTPTS
jgi:uncharacterized protein (UPF0335 family)